MSLNFGKTGETHFPVFFDDIQNNANGIPTDLDFGIRSTCCGEILIQQVGSMSHLDHL